MLGRNLRDKITGFKGICTGRVCYLTGCDQALLQPGVDKDGKVVDSAWFDIQRLEYVDDSCIVLDNHGHPGFDKAAPKR